MSIIYATLERLESTEFVPVRAVDPADLPRLTEGSGNRVMTAAILTALAVLVALTLTFLQRRGGVDGEPYSTPVPGAVRIAASGYPGDSHFVLVQNADRNAASGISADSAVPATDTDYYAGPGETSDSDSTVAESVTWEVDPLAPAPEAPADAADVRVAVVEILSPLSESPVPPDLAADVLFDVARPDRATLLPELAAPLPTPQIDPVDAAGDPPPDQAIDHAQRALSRGSYLEALTALETIRSVPPERADFWLIKGSAHLAVGQLDQADSAFQSARQLMPDNAHIIVQQAILAQERGNHASALELLADASTRHPDVPEIFLNLGYSQQALGAVPDARRSYHTFLKMTEGRSLYLQQREVVQEWLTQEEPAED